MLSHRVPLGISQVVTVEPIKFYCNEVTSVDNYFQHRDVDDVKQDDQVGIVDVDERPLLEHRRAVELLRGQIGVALHNLCLRNEVDIGEKEEIGRKIKDVEENDVKRLEKMPDAIFPNNSFMFLEISRIKLPRVMQNLIKSSDDTVILVVLFPVSPGRRNEIPKSLLDHWKKHALATFVPEFLGCAQNGVENVLDCDNNISYVVLGRSWGIRVSRQLGHDVEKNETEVLKDIPKLMLLDLRPFQDVDALVSKTFEHDTKSDKAHVITSAYSYSENSTHKGSWVLEGTGVINFSPCLNFAYAAASQRCHPVLFHLLCDVLGIGVEISVDDREKIIGPQDGYSQTLAHRQHRFLFCSARDGNGNVVYHTNVVGWVCTVAESRYNIGSGLCGWVLDSLRFVPEENNMDMSIDLSGIFCYPISTVCPIELYSRKSDFVKNLDQYYPNCIDLDYEDLVNFAGNCMFLTTLVMDDRYGVIVPYCLIAMSRTAAAQLARKFNDGESKLNKIRNILRDVNNRICRSMISDNDRNEILNASDPIVSSDISVIEHLGGGSMRCLIATSTAITEEGFQGLQFYLEPVS